MTIERYDCKSFLALPQEQACEVLGDTLLAHGSEPVKKWMEELCDGETSHYELATGMMFHKILPAYLDQLDHVNAQRESTWDRQEAFKEARAANKSRIRDQERLWSIKDRQHLEPLFVAAMETTRLKKDLNDIFEVTAPILQQSLQNFLHDDTVPTLLFDRAMAAVGEKIEPSERAVMKPLPLDPLETEPGRRDTLLCRNHLLDLDSQKEFFSSVTLEPFNDYEKTFHSSLDEAAQKRPGFAAARAVLQRTHEERMAERKARLLKPQGLAKKTLAPQRKKGAKRTKERGPAVSHVAEILAIPSSPPAAEYSAAQWNFQGEHPNSQKAALMLNDLNITSYTHLEQSLPNLLQSQSPREMLALAQALAHLGIPPRLQSADTMLRNISPPNSPTNQTHAEVVRAEKLRAWKIAYNICESLYARNDALHESRLQDSHLRSDAAMRCAKILGRCTQLDHQNRSSEISRWQRQAVNLSPRYFPHRLNLAETFIHQQDFPNAVGATKELLGVWPSSDRLDAADASLLKGFYGKLANACANSQPHAHEKSRYERMVLLPDDQFLSAHTAFQQTLRPVEKKSGRDPRRDGATHFPPGDRSGGGSRRGGGR